jgi:hypothetical protein
VDLLPNRIAGRTQILQPRAALFSGEAAGLTRDDVLDNITITWLTNTAISGARLYWENKLPFFSVKGVSIPVAVSAFPDEIDLCPSGRIRN